MTTTEISEHPLTGVVRDAMTRNVHRARREDPVSQVTRYMGEHHLRRIVVVDRRNRVLGVVSQRDILRHFLSTVQEHDEDFDRGRLAGLENATIDKLITRERPITVRPDLPLRQAAVVLGANKIGCLPVVDYYGELKGMLTLTDLLRRFAGEEKPTLEVGFEFFSPHRRRRVQMPAFIRRATKEIVVPRSCLDQFEAGSLDRVMLGFDEASGRILVKFIPSGLKVDSALPLRTTSENYVIDAGGFVDHFNLLERATTFDLHCPDDTRYLVLTPRQ